MYSPGAIGRSGGRTAIEHDACSRGVEPILCVPLLAAGANLTPGVATVVAWPMLLLVLGALPTASEALALPLACFAMAKRSVHPLTTACAASATSASPWLVNRFTALPRPLSEIWRSFPLHGVSRNRRSNTPHWKQHRAPASRLRTPSRLTIDGPLFTVKRGGRRGCTSGGQRVDGPLSHALFQQQLQVIWPYPTTLRYAQVVGEAGRPPRRECRSL